MKRYLPFVIVAAVGVIALGSGILLYRAKRISNPPDLTSAKNQATPEKPNGGSLHVLGPANAPITLEEFGDFQCPPCGALSNPINQIEKDYAPRLRVIFRQYPLVNHKHARAAAYASEAAGLQNRFWEMHDLLYREQSTWSKVEDVTPLLTAYAGIIGLKIDQFKTDMASDQVKARVTSDQQRAAGLNVTTTPTIFINDHVVPPTSLNPVSLRAAIDAAATAKLTP